jgi:hypothetical protein
MPANGCRRRSSGRPTPDKRTGGRDSEQGWLPVAGRRHARIGCNGNSSDQAASVTIYDAATGAVRAIAGQIDCNCAGWVMFP